MTDSPGFIGNPLDRASAQRTDPAWLEARLADPGSKFLALWKLDALVKASEPPTLAWATNDIRQWENRDTAAVLLGLRDGIAHFAVDLSSVQNPLEVLGLEGAASFEDARRLAAQLPVGEAGIVAQARSLIDWHATHSHCSNCGEKTRSVQGGSIRFCGDCRTEHFPRTNPVVIMLATQGDRCLLGRQSGWPAGMFSALAGFVEQGETIEDAVRREVLEESGIRVGHVRYVASQPWPFPSSLMIGCIAEAESDEIGLGDDELEEARWFDRSLIRKLLEQGAVDGVFIPPPLSLAHYLARFWA